MIVNKPSLRQIVAIRDMIADGDILENVMFQATGDVSFIKDGKLHKLDTGGEVWVSEWTYVENFRDITARVNRAA